MFSTLKLVSQEQQAKKRRKINTRKACMPCKKSHTACDAVRPCPRCTQRGLQCIDDANGNHGVPHDQSIQQQPQQLPQSAALNNSPSPPHQISQQLQPPPPSYYNQQPQQQQNIYKRKYDEYNSNDLYSQQLSAAPSLSAGLSSQQRPLYHMQQQLPPQHNNYLPSINESQQQQQQQQQQMQQQQQFMDIDTKSLINRIAKLEQLLESRNSYVAQNLPSLSNNAEQAAPMLPSSSSPPLQQPQIPVASSPALQLKPPIPFPIPSQNQQHQDAAAEEPKWPILMELNSAMIAVRDTKTMKFVAVNQKLKSFFAKKGLNFRALLTEDAQKFKNHVLPSRQPLIQFVVYNIISSQTIKLLQFVSYNEKINALVRLTLHFGNRDYFWVEVEEILPQVFDNGFKLDDYVFEPTVKLEIPQDPSAALSTYNSVSIARDQMLVNKFIEKHKVYGVKIQEVLENDYKFILNGEGNQQERSELLFDL